MARKAEASKLEAAFRRVRELELQLACQQQPYTPEVAARLSCIAPALVAQEQAADAGHEARSSSGLIHPDLHVMSVAAKHHFADSILHMTPAKARKTQKSAKRSAMPGSEASQHGANAKRRGRGRRSKNKQASSSDSQRAKSCEQSEVTDLDGDAFYSELKLEVLRELTADHSPARSCLSHNASEYDSSGDGSRCTLADSIQQLSSITDEAPDGLHADVNELDELPEGLDTLSDTFNVRFKEAQKAVDLAENGLHLDSQQCAYIASLVADAMRGQIDDTIRNHLQISSTQFGVGTAGPAPGFWSLLNADAPPFEPAMDVYPCEVATQSEVATQTFWVDSCADSQLNSGLMCDASAQAAACLTDMASQTDLVTGVSFGSACDKGAFTEAQGPVDESCGASLHTITSCNFVEASSPVAHTQHDCSACATECDKGDLFNHTHASDAAILRSEVLEQACQVPETHAVAQPALANVVSRRWTDLEDDDLLISAQTDDPEDAEPSALQCALQTPASSCHVSVMQSEHCKTLPPSGGTTAAFHDVTDQDTAVHASTGHSKVVSSPDDTSQNDNSCIGQGRGRSARRRRGYEQELQLEPLVYQAVEVIQSKAPRRHCNFRSVRNNLQEMARRAPEGSETFELVTAILQKLEDT